MGGVRKGFNNVANNEGVAFNLKAAAGVPFLSDNAYQTAADPLELFKQPVGEEAPAIQPGATAPNVDNAAVAGDEQASKLRARRGRASTVLAGNVAASDKTSRASSLLGR